MLIQKIKTELRKLDIKPKKGLGQNFLVNENAYKKIVDALELTPNDTVVEVGPGLGTLTKLLSASGAAVLAVEKDRLLADYLKIKFANNNSVTIVEEDILNFNPKRYTLNAKRFKVVGNIPYYLTSHLLRIVLESWPRPELLVLMLQKEVAQRICAKPPRMSLLAVSIQYYAQPKLISYVSRGSFYPSPEVDSAIIKLVVSDQFSTVNDKTINSEKTSNPRSLNGHKLQTVNFFRIARAGFAKKRKQLVNNLSTELKITKNEVEVKLTAVGIDPRRRAETLTIDEWQKVTNTFYSQD